MNARMNENIPSVPAVRHDTAASVPVNQKPTSVPGAGLVPGACWCLVPGAWCLVPACFGGIAASSSQGMMLMNGLRNGDRDEAPLELLAMDLRGPIREMQRHCSGRRNATGAFR